MIKNLLVIIFLVMLAALTAAPEVWAQDVQDQQDQNAIELEEITVTATKRETALEDTPMAISVVTGDMMDEQGRIDIYDILKNIPGLVSVNEPDNGAMFGIRGVSGGIAHRNKGDIGVATNIDGTYLSPLVDNPLFMSFYDIARMEVLRGPQGTLYGRNAEAGVLNVITNDPTDKLEGSGTFELGNYSLTYISGAVNSPLSDNSALRLAFQDYTRDAYLTDGSGAENSTAGRIKYLYKSGDTLRLLVGSELSKRQSTKGQYRWNYAFGLGDYPDGDPYDNVTKDGGLTGEDPVGSPAEDKSIKVWGQLDWKTPIGTVTFIPSYSESKSGGYSQTNDRGSSSKDDQKTFEARLNSSSDSTFDYILGIFYLDAGTRSWQWWYNTPVIDQLRVVTQTSEAVFGQGTYHFTDTFRGTLGLRYTRDKKDYYTEEPEFGTGGAASGGAEWTRMDWKVGLEMDIFKDSLVYANVATGYRPGAVNTSAAGTALDMGGNEVAYPNVYTKPEELLSYEVGAKTSFFNNHLTVNADAYYYDYSDRQYAEFFLVPLTFQCPTGTKPSDMSMIVPGMGACYTMRNLSKVESYGGELSAIWSPTDNDSIDFSVAHLKAYVAESQEVLVSPIGETMDAKGATLPDSPKWQINASWEHRFDFAPGSLFLRGDGRYESKNYIGDFSYLNPGQTTIHYPGGFSRTYSTRDIYTNDPHTVFDFTATFLMSDGALRFSAYVKNITKEYWKVFTDGSKTQITAPRTYGVTFTVRF